MGGDHSPSPSPPAARVSQLLREELGSPEPLTQSSIFTPPGTDQRTQLPRKNRGPEKAGLAGGHTVLRAGGGEPCSNHSGLQVAAGGARDRHSPPEKGRKGPPQLQPEPRLDFRKNFPTSGGSPLEGPGKCLNVAEGFSFPLALWLWEGPVPL